MLTTGAVLTGRRTFDLAGAWAGDQHDGVPIFVLTSRIPDDTPYPLVTYFTDVATAAERAREATGDTDVLLHAARTAQLALAAGVLDEIQIHLIPILVDPELHNTNPAATLRAGAIDLAEPGCRAGERRGQPLGDV